MGFEKYDFKFDFGGADVNVLFQASFQDSEIIARMDISDEFTGPVYGHVWAIARAIVQSGLDWDDWECYHSYIAEKYRSLLDGRPEYRYSVWNSEREKNKIMWDRYALSCILYESEYAPKGVMMPTFVEGSTGRLSDFRRFADETGLSCDALDNYFLRSFDSDRIFLLECSGFDEDAKNEMIECGVIRTGYEIDRSVMTSNLNFSQARAILIKLGIKPDKSVGKCRNQLLNEIDEENCDAIELIQLAKDWTLYGEIRAITGYDWDDFQSFRQQVRGAATALVNIYEKIVTPDLKKRLV